jgi:hypothetical protein
VRRDQRVEELERLVHQPGCPCGALVPEGVQQVDARCGPRRDPAVGSDEVPRREALVLGERSDQRFRGVVLEREQADPAVEIGGRDGTRREPAEPSAAVVEEHGSMELHRLIVPAPRA